MESLENPYLLLTPGPLSTSPSVRESMLKDWCTWDTEYNDLVQQIRKALVRLACRNYADYSCVLMQGSGTFCVEAALGSCVPEQGKILILANGAYGERMAKIAQVLKLDHDVISFPENEKVDAETLHNYLSKNQEVTHVAMVHVETTTGMLNPIRKISKQVKAHKRIFVLDAMSSFGGIPLDMEKDRIDILISSANKCIQGVPGFGFVIANKKILKAAKGNARSLSLDLYDQWRTMESHEGKWRYTSPTHTVRAFYQAMVELKEEGGIDSRYKRYCDNHDKLVEGMLALGFTCYLPFIFQSPIITSFINPDHPDYRFEKFYKALKKRGYVIYPGKVTDADTFRIGNIGHVFKKDIKKLLEAIEQSIYWK